MKDHPEIRNIAYDNKDIPELYAQQVITRAFYMTELKELIELIIEYLKNEEPTLC